MRLTGLLVGQSFRPPAKLLLEALPNGSALILEPEPWNPHDPHAIKVLVDPIQLDKEKHEWLEAELPSAGRNLQEILAEESIHLGYLAKEENKARAKCNATGNRVIGQMMNKESVAKLRLGPNGETLVDVEI